MTTDTSATRNRAGTAATPAPGQAMGDPRRFNVKGWLLWTAAFVSFPIAGIAAVAAKTSWSPTLVLGSERHYA
jgi:hypothetical protein